MDDGSTRTRRAFVLVLEGAPMFDVYMHAHEIDPRARRKMMALLSIATIATTVSLASALLGERLGITRVAAPKVESLLVMPTDEMPAALQSPPPSAGAPPEPTDEVTDPETPPDPSPKTKSELAPLDHDDRSSTKSPTGTGPGPDVTGPTNPLGPIGPHSLPCAVPGTCARIPPHPTTPSTPKDKPTFESIDVVRERAIATPNPRQSELARTPAGIARRSGTTKVGFCIDTSGKTTDVRTRQTAGDEDVDRICRDTVKLWRFRAMEVEGRARVTCTEVTFQIAFE